MGKIFLQGSANRTYRDYPYDPLLTKNLFMQQKTAQKTAVNAKISAKVVDLLAYFFP